MDNISGKANWFCQDKEPEPEKVEVTTEKYTPILDVNLISGALYQAQKDYSVTSRKNLGDAIIHLEIALNLLNN